MAEITYAPPEARVSFSELGERYLHHVEHVMGRKPATVQDYAIMLRKHLAPHFAAKAVERITADDVASYMAFKRRDGLAVKTIANHLTFAHGVFAFALKRGMIQANPVAAVERPTSAPVDADFRYLDREQLEALLRAVPDDTLGATDRALYLTAALTGLRQGELAALRWRDVDWSAGVIRVRRNFTRGEWGTPKSRRSTRAVPLADRLAAELDRHFQRSAFQSDDHLVLGHPHTGKPYDASRMRERFYGAMRSAGLGHLIGRANGITFHSLRHTFGTRMAAVGVPMRTLQEWMGHKDYATTAIYADFSPDATQGAAFAELAFGPSTNPSTNLRATQGNLNPLTPSKTVGSA
ncbi:MAG: site-specific integrase [Solirubrobacterales bacterium]|nr:site-specific integrase [Solirubrobacterales bacterium]